MNERAGRNARRPAALLVVLLLCVGTLATFFSLRSGSNLPDEDMVELKQLSDVPAALRWRDETARLALPYHDPESARTDGYVPMDSLDVSKWEHLFKWTAVEDDRVLDPREPEGFLYSVEDGRWALRAVVYIMPTRYNFANTTRIAGGAGQWHSHPTICLKGDPLETPALGVVDPFCAAGRNFPDTLMLHVWVTPNACGPFAPLIIDDIQLVQEALSGLDENGSLQECDGALTELVWPELAGAGGKP